MSVNNGSRVMVTLPDFTGLAGFVEKDGVATLSYRAAGNQRLRVGSKVPIEDAEWEVTAVADSPLVKGFRVVTLRAAVEG